jgi:methylenetetrahydrofolate reductase (NADPH)
MEFPSADNHGATMGEQSGSGAGHSVHLLPDPTLGRRAPGMMGEPSEDRLLLHQALTSGHTAITAEVTPPRGGDPTRTLAAAACLRGRVHAINVTDGSRAVMRMSSLAMCKLLLDQGFEPVLQLTCRDRNRIALQAELLGAHALGLRNLLCLTGDPVRAGDQPGARPVNELESVRLLQLVESLNQGRDPVKGHLPDGGTAFFAGAAADPQSPSWSGLQARLRRKQAAGARFIQTQMVTDGDALRRFIEEIAGPLGLPVLAGVFLLKSARNAEFINRVVPGANIPQGLIDRLASAADPAAEGVRIAAEQVTQYVGIAQGVHLMAIKAEERIPRILELAGLSPLRDAGALEEVGSPGVTLRPTG